MTFDNRSALSRRRVLLAGAAAGTSMLLPSIRNAAEATNPKTFTLRASRGKVQLAPAPNASSNVWAYNGQVQGPELRLRQGECVKILVENQLNEETTVHWHGLRVPHNMDGVPHLTQKPIAAGSTFTYEFDVPDAGTYWYHPHQRSFEQVGRGLYGPLIIEERTPIAVDRDITWVLDDWRLGRDAQISNDFGNRHDMSHNGRVGNTVTINGRVLEEFKVKRGERIRLRLINTANARIFGLDLGSLNPQVIALDGQPVQPHSPPGGRIVLGPAMRADIVLDMMGKPGQRISVVDNFYNRLAYRLLDIVYEPAIVRERPLETNIVLAPNTMPEPDMGSAQRHEVRFNGGMMGGMMMGRGSNSGGMANMMQMMRSGKMWLINGVAATGHVMDPLVTLDKGCTYVLDMQNDTAWHHPIHLHGHSFRVVSRNGIATEHREWQDTVLMSPRERVEIAFVADNPGDWMFHCHILEHQAAGMMGVIRVKGGSTKT